MVERSVMGEERLREIGRELRRLRTAAGLSGVGLASRAGVPQPTVSRVETGRRVSDPDVVARLFRALELGPDEVEQLAGLVRDAYAETAPRRSDAGVSFRAGTGVELAPPRTKTAVRHPSLEGAEQRFSFVVGEAALRTWPGSGDCMAGQLAHLLAVSGLEGVRLGVVPREITPRVPLHGFSVYDDAAVTVETFTREITLSDAGEVRAYVEIFEGFERAAVFGDSARALVEDAARDLRETLGFIH